MSERQTKRRLNLTDIPQWLLLLSGAACVAVGVIGFFTVVAVRTPVGSPGVRTEVELLLGRLTVSQYSLKGGTAAPAEAREWEFEIQPSDLPLQLKFQELTRAFTPWSGDSLGVIYSFEYVPGSPMKGGGVVVCLIPVGSLCVTLSLVWTYWRRRRRRLAAAS